MCMIQMDPMRAYFFIYSCLLPSLQACLIGASLCSLLVDFCNLRLLMLFCCASASHICSFNHQFICLQLPFWHTQASTAAQPISGATILKGHVLLLTNCLCTSSSFFA